MFICRNYAVLQAKNAYHYLTKRILHCDGWYTKSTDESADLLDYNIFARTQQDESVNKSQYVNNFKRVPNSKQVVKPHYMTRQDELFPYHDTNKDAQYKRPVVS
jgi:hypothetical protein